MRKKIMVSKGKHLYDYYKNEWFQIKFDLWLVMRSCNSIAWTLLKNIHSNSNLRYVLPFSELTCFHKNINLIFVCNITSFSATYILSWINLLFFYLASVESKWWNIEYEMTCAETGMWPRMILWSDTLWTLSWID